MWFSGYHIRPHGFRQFKRPLEMHYNTHLKRKRLPQETIQTNVVMKQCYN